MKSSHIIGFVLDCLKPFKWLIAGQFVIAFVFAIDVSLRPYLLKLIFDKIPTLNGETVVSGLSGLIIFYIFMSLLIVILFRFYDFLLLNLIPPLRHHIGDTLIKKMMGHSQSFFQDQFAGSLANKIKDVMNSLPEILRVTIDGFFAIILSSAFAIFTVWTIDFKFAIVLASWLFVFISGTALFTKHAKIVSAQAAEVKSTVMGQIVDILSNIMNVHLFAAKNTESEKLRIHLDNSVVADQRRDWWFLYMFSFQGLSFVVYQVIVFTLLLNGFTQGVVTAGDFVLLVTINVSIVNNIWNLSMHIQRFSEFMGNITQGLTVALAPHDIRDKPDAKEIRVTKGQIIFDKVGFHYKGSKPLFANKSVTIEAGQKVGLVGYSGGGKTTFSNLILRLYGVTDGCITIDGYDIRDVTQDSLRTNIGMIPQDPSLFHRTLMENIRYGRDSATDAEVIEAAKRAHADEFIVKLPNAYDSLVGERGVKLSGGQRQRVAIARAILKNAPILILDEATSQLDSVTERDIQDSVWDLMQHKTTIVIAHRLSTLLHMDRILVFDGGKIVEDGTHDELLARGGLYKTLWDAQVGGFLPDVRDADNNNYFAQTHLKTVY